MRRPTLLHARRAYVPALLLASLAAVCISGSSRAATDVNRAKAAPAAGVAAAAVNGLVGAYSFDAGSGTSVTDSSGAANTGTLSGATWTSGKTGNALTFDGVNDWVTIPDAASLDLTSGMTLEAWVNPTAQDDIWRTVVTKETSGNLTYGLFSNSDTSQPVAVATIGSSPLQSIARGTGAVGAAAWTHLAATYNGARLRLYVNGALVRNQPVTGAMANSAGALRIGGNAVWAEWFSGQIDDLRIYNKALTAAQLVTDMNTPVGGTPADTQAPTAPGGLVASGQTQTQITLSWTPSSDNVGVTGYSRYSNGTLTSSGAGTSFAFTGLACGTSYVLAVDAYDAAGNRSTRPSVSATTTACSPPPPDTQAPTAPSGLVAGGQAQTQITLSWTASTDNVGVTGYSRYRAGALISSGTGTSFTFTGLVCGTSYVLAVDAYDAAGNRSTRPSLTATTQPCATGPIAAYSFDATSGTSLTDNSGNGNTGAIAGAAWTTAGKSGGALSFNGVSDIVTIADKASLDLTTGMTLEAWIRPTANSVWRTIVTKETTGNLTYGLFSNSDVPQPSTIVSIGSNPIQDSATGPTEVPLSAWAHLAATYDGAVLRLYLDGTQVATKNVTGAMANSTGPLQIGGNNVWSEWFQGQIDDLRIYNRALAPAELQTDMNTPVAPPPPADTQAPTAPTGLAASGQTQTQATLSWTASTDNVGVAGYSYYRGGTLIGNGTGTSYTFTGLACGTSYVLDVDAYDAAGNRSTRPSVSAATSACAPPPPPDTQAPSTPAGLAVSGQAQTALTLSWNASTDNVGVTGYSTYSNTVLTGSTAAATRTYSYTGLTCGTTYALAVDAVDAAGNRSAKGTVNGTTSACTPPPPPPPGNGTANLWVDTNGGSCARQGTPAVYSDAQACSSLQAAYNAAAAGDTVNIADGTYGGVTLASGTKAITFRAAGPGRPSFGHFVSAASNSTVRGILIQDRNDQSGTCGNASWGVLNPCTSNQTYDNVIVDGLNTGDKHGIESPGNGTVFKNGEIRNILNMKGLEGGADDMVIENNYWHNITVNADTVHNECAFINGGDRSIYRGNRFIGCPTMALFFTNWNGGPAYRDVLIENNVFGHTLDASGGWHASCAFKVGWGYNNQNTVLGWVVRYNTFETGPCIDGTPAGGDNGAGQWYGNLGGNSCAAEWVYRYNVGQTCGGTGEVSVANAVNGNGSSNVAPFYVNAPAGDFHLKSGAAAIDRGLPGTYPATDLDGKARPVGPAADTGAYEFG